MHRSHVIEVSGQFAGAAVSHDGLFRFIAVDPRVAELDHSIWPSLPDVQRVVDHLLTTGRLPAARSNPDAPWDAPPRQSIEPRTPVFHGEAP